MKAVRTAVAVAAVASLTSCATATAEPTGLTYDDCVTQIVRDAADIPEDVNLDDADVDVATCTVAVGEHAGRVVTIGRSRNVVQFDGPDGVTGQRIAGTYHDCADMLTWLTDSCLAIDGPWPFAELTLRDGRVEPL